jgi:hypothetical protein
MKYTTINLILHVPEKVDIDYTILHLKDAAIQAHKDNYVAVCETSEWRESEDYIFSTDTLAKLPKSNQQY